MAIQFTWTCRYARSHPLILAPSNEGVYLVSIEISNLGYHPVLLASRSNMGMTTGVNHILYQNIYKKFLNPIDKPILIMYIIDIET